jgi:hypothetical protein
MADTETELERLIRDLAVDDTETVGFEETDTRGEYDICFERGDILDSDKLRETVLAHLDKIQFLTFNVRRWTLEDQSFLIHLIAASKSLNRVDFSKIDVGFMSPNRNNYDFKMACYGAAIANRNVSQISLSTGIREIAAAEVGKVIDLVGPKLTNLYLDEDVGVGPDVAKHWGSSIASLPNLRSFDLLTSTNDFVREVMTALSRERADPRLEELEIGEKLNSTPPGGNPLIGVENFLGSPAATNLKKLTFDVWTLHTPTLQQLTMRLYNLQIEELRFELMRPVYAERSEILSDLIRNCPATLEVFVCRYCAALIPAFKENCTIDAQRGRAQKRRAYPGAFVRKRHHKTLVLLSRLG